MREEVIQLLITEAAKARQMAYAPYSGYLVGAALVVPSGKIYTGCNVENASYGLTNCAERTAIFKAVSEGQRHIDAIAIVGGPIDSGVGEVTEMPDYAYPCGACRELMLQLDKDSKNIKFLTNTDTYEYVTMEELMPNWWGYSRFQEKNTNE